MATKTITIMNDAYERLASRKKPGESFSDVIRGLTEKNKGSLVDCAGLFADWPKERWDKFEKTLVERRKANLKRAEKRLQWFKSTV